MANENVEELQKIKDAGGTVTQTPPTEEGYSYNPRGAYERSLQRNLNNNVPNTTQTVQPIGQETAEQIQNVVPRNSVKTYKDIMADPQFKGKRGAYVVDTLGGTLAALGSRKKEDTAMNQMNRVLENQYAQDLADVNTRAKNAQIEPLEAANKQRTDLELRLADTVANSYLERYKAAQDTETKRQVLLQMIKDKDLWASLDFDEKLDTIMYMRSLGAQSSVLDMLMQQYLPGIIGGKGSGDGNGGSEDPLKDYKITIGDNELSGWDVANMWATNPDMLKKMIAGIVDENGNPDYAAQQQKLFELGTGYMKAGGDLWGNPVKKLQADLDFRKSQDETNQKLAEKNKNQAAVTTQARTSYYKNLIDTAIAKNSGDMSNRKMSYDDRISNLEDAVMDYENNVAQAYQMPFNNEEVQAQLSDGEKTSYANLKDEIQKLKDGKVAKVFDTSVKNALGKNPAKEKPETVLTNINKLKKSDTYAPYQARGTFGAYDLITYMQNVRSKANGNSQLAFLYNTAVDKLGELLDYTPEELASMQIAKVQKK